MKGRLILVLIFSITLVIYCGGAKRSVEKETVTEESIVKPDTTKKMESKTVSQPTKVTESKQVQTFEIESKQPVVKTRKDTTIIKPVEKKAKLGAEKIDTMKIATTSTQKPVVIEKKAVSIQKSKAPSKEKEQITYKMDEKALNLLSTTFEDIYFDQGEYKIPSMTFNSSYIVIIAKVVKALRKDRDVKIRLFGHTGNLGIEKDNKQLALERAKTIGKLILDMFNDNEKKTMSKRVEIISVGSDNPVVTSKEKSKDFLNRRVSIELTYDKTKLGKLYSELIEKKETPVKEIKVTEVRPKSVSSQNIEEIYKNGISLIEGKNYRDAITTFYNIVKYNPQHNLADNAQWWIGEAYYYMKDYNNALDAYSKVFNLGDGNKSAYARYRIGLCYLKMGDKKRAIEELEKVIKDYPAAKEERQKALNVLKNIRGS